MCLDKKKKEEEEKRDNIYGASLWGGGSWVGPV